MRDLLIQPTYAASRAIIHADVKRGLAEQASGKKKQSMDDVVAYYKAIYRTRDEYEVEENGTAKIHIFGLLGGKFDPIYRKIGLLTDYEDVERELEMALEDSRVKRILLDCESGGGYALGVDSVARKILDARGKKEIYAYTDEVCASACYYLAAGATAIYASSDAIVGSIGTRMEFFTYAKLLEQAGIEAQEFKASGSDLKAAGSPWHTPTAEEKAFLQASMDATNARFIGHVSTARPGLDVEVFRAGHYSGEEAQDLGLIDGILSRAELMHAIS